MGAIDPTESDQSRERRALENYKRALQRKDEILWTTQKAYEEVLHDRDLLVQKLTHVLKLLADVRESVHTEGQRFTSLELRYEPHTRD